MSVQMGVGADLVAEVDRYGVTKRGEQYASWRHLTTGATDDKPNFERGRRLIADAGGVRAAEKATHPDLGGDPIDFQSVQLVKEHG